MILLIDNYDSFTYNLAQYLATFTEVEVVRNDDSNLLEQAKGAEALVLSPGPGWPKHAGQLEMIIEKMANQKPILGICLGHQAIAEVFGGRLALAGQVMHGKQSQMALTGQSSLFADLPETVDIMRYHSIVVETLPANFEVKGLTTDDQEIMAIEHKDLPIFGLQFHPESIGTPLGLSMIENFVKLVKG